MSINFDRMKEKLAKVQGGNGNKSVFWRPQDGESVLRIVPTPDGDPFKDFWFHYNVGKNPGFLSPKRNFGEECPLDDFVRNLFNEGTEDSIKMAKNLMARQRFFSPVLFEERKNKEYVYGAMESSHIRNFLIWFLILNMEISRM